MGARAGIAYLVGAGPGDPGLLTVRATELIASADVILHDRLIPRSALAGARDDAERVYVGKSPGEKGTSQAETTKLLVKHAKAGRSVVRLKGGDPFVFGRGGEEAAALAEAGVPFEVVPGVSAGIAAPAYAGIPVTNRGDASAVAFVTGHEDPVKEAASGSDLDYSALAGFPGTLVFYMGVKRLPELAEALISAGRDPGEPAAVIERGTLPDQRVIEAPLASLPGEVAQAGVKPPALVVVGEVTGRRAALGWLEARPLWGKRVVVTRARAQASGLAGRLAELGADVVELPAIRIEPRIDEPIVAHAIEALGEYSLVCLTSPNGVGLLFEALGAKELDARALAGSTVAAIGPGTARELAEHGITADVVPERSLAESLVEALAGVEVEGKSVLIARAAEARDVLPDALKKRGAKVDVVPLYETVAEELAKEELARVAGADYVTFTSSSTVTRFAEAVGGGGGDGQAGGALGTARVVSIGPVTTQTATELGLEVAIEAEQHDIDGLLAALLADAETR